MYRASGKLPKFISVHESNDTPYGKEIWVQAQQPRKNDSFLQVF